MRQKARPYRVDDGAHGIEISDLPVIAFGQVGRKDVLVLKNGEDGYFAQHHDPGVGTSVEPLTLRQAQLYFIELPEKYTTFEEAFDVRTIGPDYTPGISRTDLLFNG